jgi:hypothetical protein
MATSSDGARARLIKTRRGPWIDESLLPPARQECLETLRAAAGAMKARGQDPIYGGFAVLFWLSPSRIREFELLR